MINVLFIIIIVIIILSCYSYCHSGDNMSKQQTCHQHQHLWENFPTDTSAIIFRQLGFVMDFQPYYWKNIYVYIHFIEGGKVDEKKSK